MDINNLITEHMGYAEALACQIKRKLPKYIDIDDLISQAYVGLVESANSYKESCGSFRTWVFKRVRGSILDFLRKQKNNIDIDDNYFESKTDNMFEIFDFLENRAGKQQADMVIMYCLYGFSLKDVAHKYNLSDARICQIVNSTKEKLKDLAA